MVMDSITTRMNKIYSIKEITPYYGTLPYILSLQGLTIVEALLYLVTTSYVAIGTPYTEIISN